ncbi:MAG: DUF2807 domain-containing protein [Bacteroidota bacterium]
MKKSIALFAILLITSIAFAQKKDKIKGSKIVTIEQKKIESFTGIEVSDNLEVMLIKGDECAIEIEADDNLHDVIDFSLSGSTLRLGTLKDVISSKKLSVRLTYTNDFKMVVAKNESNVTALSDIDLDDITFKSFDYAKVYLNAQCTNFTLECNDKSKVELKLKSEKATINLSKNASLKALITSKEMIFDMYQKTDAAIEGDVVDLKLRLDNNATFVGKNLMVQNATITTEGYTNSSVNVQQNVVIDASVKSEIELYGEPKIEIKRFIDSAVLKKKPLK